MCLTLTADERDVLVAEEDIVCYKILYTIKDYLDFYNIKDCPDFNMSLMLSRIEYKSIMDVHVLDGLGYLYMSPYRRSPYVIGETYTSVLGEAVERSSGNMFSVEKGLHTYAKLADAKADTFDGVLIVKCRIPAGSKYYKGKFFTIGSPVESYASDTLVLDEVVGD